VGSGPLSGIRVIELAGIGPAPFCGMMLGDLGAQVLRVERASASQDATEPLDCTLRNRRSIALNLKHPRGIDTLLTLIARTDILLEGLRPGVMERLGLGPEPCLQRNPKLIYGRMTGWGQTGPLSRAAGHDINYIALSGALHLIGPAGGKPVVPLNLVGDFGGGGMLMAFGLLAALIETQQSGRGQIVDVSMVDGTVALMNMFLTLRHQGRAHDGTGKYFLGGAAPWYDTYATRDGKYVAVGALEPQFFALLLEKLGLEVQRFAPLGYPATDDATREHWPELRAAMSAAFASRTRDEWCTLLEGTDACFAPVLTTAEAAQHPHNVARGTFVHIDGALQNAPAPRFSRTPGSIEAPRPAGSDSERVLSEAGFSASEIDELRAVGALS
jgi:alpha-methylacyl-CoA racemase